MALGYHLEEIHRHGGAVRWRIHWSFDGTKRISPVFTTRAEALEFAEFAEIELAAEALDVSPRSVYRLISSGALRSIRRDGKTKIRWTELRRFAADRRFEQESA